MLSIRAKYFKRLCDHGEKAKWLCYIKVVVKNITDLVN